MLLTHIKSYATCNDQYYLTGHLAGHGANVALRFSCTLSIWSVLNLCMLVVPKILVVVLVELYPLTQLSVTLSVVKVDDVRPSLAKMTTTSR